MTRYQVEAEHLAKWRATVLFNVTLATAWLLGAKITRTEAQS